MEKQWSRHDPLRVLVAGGSGFIGRHLVDRLLAEGHIAAALVRRSSFVPPVEEIVVPEWNARTLAPALDGRRFDWVFNLAAGGVTPGDRDREELYRLNAECARALTQCSAAMHALCHVHAGSCAEYAAAEGPIAEDAPLESEKLYGASKSAGTLASLAAAKAANLPFVGARLFGVYGPGEAPHRLLPWLLSKLESGERVPLSPGDQVRDVLHVSDAVDGLIALARAFSDSGGADIVNLCTGEGASVRRFADIVAREFGADPSLLGFGDQPYRSDDAMSLVGGTRKLHALTNWRPGLKLEEGIAQSIRNMQYAKA